MSDLCSCKQKKGEQMYEKYRDVIDSTIITWDKLDNLIKNQWVLFANNIKKTVNKEVQPSVVFVPDHEKRKKPKKN